MFFTIIREMGLALHEMYDVSGMMIGDAPYEEYVPSMQKLHLLKKSDPLVYDTFWEVLCHFHIYWQVTGWRSGGINQMSWANYLFPRVNKANPMARLALSTTGEEIFERISASTSFYHSLTRIPANQIRFLRASTIKSKSRCLTRLYWRVFSCYG